MLEPSDRDGLRGPRISSAKAARTLDLSFVALMGGIVVGSVRQTPVIVGKTPALLLGPLLCGLNGKSGALAAS